LRRNLQIERPSQSVAANRKLAKTVAATSFASINSTMQPSDAVVSIQHTRLPIIKPLKATSAPRWV
jgi:hypothetical protein